MMIEKKVLRELETAMGRGKVFSDKEYLLAYSYDATAMEFGLTDEWWSLIKNERIESGKFGL